MRILVVEDDKSLHRIIVKRLHEEGYTVDSCYDGEEGLAYAQAVSYDCIILDLMLPKLDGSELLKQLREKGNRSGVLILTARDSIEDRVAGLDTGADDYLVKPFAFDELLARVRSTLRRQGGGKEPVLTLGDLKMDCAAHEVTRGGKKLTLTVKEYALLEYLLRNKGHTVTHSQISDHVWNYEFDYDSNIVNVYIRYLRHKVDRDFPQKLIHTVRGFGYVMREEDE